MASRLLGVNSYLPIALSAYPRTLWEGASLGPAPPRRVQDVAGGRESLNNQMVLGRALSFICVPSVAFQKNKKEETDSPQSFVSFCAFCGYVTSDS